MSYLSPVLELLSNPKALAALAVSAAVGALWWQLEAKQSELQAARDSLQVAAQQNAALRDSLQKDTTYVEDGILRSIYSMTDSLGDSSEEAPSTVESEGREVTGRTTAVYEADSAAAEGTASPKAAGDTLRYRIDTEAGRYGVSARLKVWPEGRLDYWLGVDPPPVELRLYRTERPGPSGAPITETHIGVPGGTVRSLQTTRPARQATPKPGSPWTYGVAAASDFESVYFGPRLDYARGPFYVSLSGGYSPPGLRPAAASPFSYGIEVGVTF